MTENSIKRPRVTVHHYQELFNFLPDGYLETDPTGIIQQANRAAASLFRVNQDSLVGQSVLDFVAGELAERQNFQNQLTQLTHLERLQDWEVMLQPGDGAPFLASLTVGVVLETGGQLAGLRWLLHDASERQQAEEAFRNKLQESNLAYQQAIAYARDLTSEIIKHRQAEAALWESKERYHSLVEASPDGIVLADLNANITMVNQQAVRLLGYERVEEMIGKSGFDFIAPEDLPRATEHLGQTFETGSVRDAQYTLLRKDGTRFLAELSATLIRDAQGMPQALTGVMRDITRRNRAEKALSRQAKEMAALYETALEINAQPDLPTLLRIIVRRAATLLGTDQGGIFLLKSDGQTLEMAAAHNQQEDFQGVTVRMGQGLTGRVAQTGEPLMVADYPSWPGKIEPLKLGSVGHILGVPLKQREQVIGVLTVWDDERIGEFSEGDVRLLSLFANQVAIAIERAQLFNETQLQVRRLTLINRLASEMTGLSDIRNLCTVIAQHLHTAFNYYNVAVFTFDPTSRQLVLQVNTGGYAGIIQPGEYRQVIGQGIIGQAAEAGEVLLVNDTRQYPGFFELEEMTIFSELAIPLKIGGQLIGVLNVDGDQPNAFDHNDVTLLTTIGDQLAVALEKARLFEAEHRRRQEAETLRDTMMLLASTLNLNQVLEKILVQLEQVVTFDSVCIFLLDKDTLYAIAGEGFPDSKRVIGLSRPTDSPLFQEILQTRRPLILVNAQADPRFEHWGGTEHVRGWMGIPLLVYGEVIGYLALDSRQVAAYGQAEADLAQAFANQAAIAIENARLHAKSEWRAEQLTMLNKAGRAMASSLDLDYVLEQVVIEATTLVEAEGASLLLLEPKGDELTFVASVSLASEQLVGTRMPATAGIAGRAVQARQSVLGANVQRDPHFYPEIDALTQLTTHSLIAVPLIARDKVIGVIEVVNKLAGSFDQSNLDVLEALGSSAAIAIENARLFETTHHSQERYRHLFDDSPISIREEDYSEVKTYLDRLQAAGVKDLDAYFKQHPGELMSCARMVKVTEVNKACVTLYQANHKVELLTGLDPLFTGERYDTFRNQLAAMTAGQTTYDCETVNQTLSGNRIHVWLRLSITPGYEDTWSKVLVSIVDITALKKAESVVMRQRQELRRLSTQLINTQEAERKHLAHELHDEMGQALTSIGLNLDLIAQDLPPSFPSLTREMLAGTILLVDQTLAQVRELSLNLRPSMLDDFGLEATLSWYVKQYAARGTVEVEFDTREFEGRLKGEVEIALYRVVQEALTNVARHAQAKRVYLRLARQGAMVTAFIEDDGQGFDVEEAANRRASEPGLGLLGIRERVTALDGRLKVQSQPGRGTRLFIEIPI